MDRREGDGTALKQPGRIGPSGPGTTASTPRQGSDLSPSRAGASPAVEAPPGLGRPSQGESRDDPGAHRRAPVARQRWRAIMPTEAKQAVVAELREELAGHRTLIVSEYRGLT